MKQYKLTSEEKKLEREILAGEWVPVKKAEKNRIMNELRVAAQNHLKDSMITFRIAKFDIIEFKKKADEVGVPYQTLLSAFVKQYPKGKATLTI